MRVLFLHPNFDAPLGVSIGVSYIAATLRRGGHEVGALHLSELLGYPFDLERVVADVERFDPGLLAITSGFNHYAEMRQVVAAVTGRLGIPCLLGGIHATLNGRAVMDENPVLAFANVGEGELPTLELADALEAGRDPSGIANLLVRTSSGIRENAPRPFLELSTLADMATDIWDFQGVIDRRRGWVNVSAQRGCPYRCPYCHNNGVARVLAERRRLESSGNAALGFLRFRPPADVVHELCRIRERYRLQAFSFIDDTFTMNHEWLTELLELYGREVGVPFVCNTTAIDLDGVILDAMAAAGCRIVRMGVESGSERVVDEVLERRFIGRDVLRWAFRAVQERGMHALAYNMIGNSGETRAEVEATFRFNAELAPSSMKLSLAQPYPGTDYHALARGRSEIDPEARVHKFIEKSVLRRADDERLWLDKARTFYFWYVSRELRNEGSPGFAQLIDELERLPEERWRRSDVRAELWRRHEELSRDLKARGVLHYTAPFGERTDIVVSGLLLAGHGELIRREQADPH